MVFVYSACDVFYGSYYIYGLQKLLGKSQVKFSISHFPKFPQGTFAAIYIEGKRQRKIIIDPFDSSLIEAEALQWCDEYYKVNVSFDNNNPKVIPIGPSFGIKIWSLRQTLYYSILNYFLSRKRLSNPRRFFGKYYSQYKRLRIEAYKNNTKPSNYIFFTSTIWKKEPETNKLRANFIKACKESDGIEFEGGFAPRPSNDIRGYEDLTVSSLYKVEDYIEKIKQSVCVFNTPVVLKCHGWKLGEFLAMGKAIISTPLSRELPSALEPGKHLLITSGEKSELQNAISKLLNEPETKATLEKNTEEYFKKYLSPEAVAKKIISNTY